MVDLVASGERVDLWADRSLEVLAEQDAGEREEAFLDAVEGAGAVAFEGEEVLAGPDGRLDGLPDCGEVAALPGFVFGGGSLDRCAEFADSGGELAPAVALVSEQRPTFSSVERAGSSSETPAASPPAGESVSAPGVREFRSG